MAVGELTGRMQAVEDRVGAGHRAVISELHDIRASLDHKTEEIERKAHAKIDPLEGRLRHLEKKQSGMLMTLASLPVIGGALAVAYNILHKSGGAG